MDLNTTSWRLKIDRAKEHFAALDSDIRAWAGTFSELAGVLHTIVEEVERIMAALETVVGQISDPSPGSPKQTAHFMVTTR